MIETLASYFLARKRLITIVSIFFIISVSSLFRLTNLSLIEFKTDEASNLFLATRYLFGHPIPLGGTGTSLGTINPPLFIYILMAFTFFSTSPLVISGIIAFINSIVLGFFFFYLRKYYGSSTAFTTTTLIALSPWMILFSRKIWPPDLVIGFVIIQLFFIHKILFERKNNYWIFFTAISLLTIQLDLVYIIYGGVLGSLLLLQQRSLPVKKILFGTFFGILPLIPYFILQFTKGCPDCSVYLNDHHALINGFSLKIFFRPLQLMHQGDFFSLLGNDIAHFAAKYQGIYLGKIVFYTEYLLLPLGMFLYWRKMRRTRILIYTSVLLLCIYFLLRISPYSHYFIVILPFFFLFLGYCFSVLFRNTNYIIKSFSFILFVTLILESLLYNKAFFSFVHDKKVIAGDYGSTYAISERIAKDRLKEYESTPEYDEITIASYLPPAISHGTDPFALVAFDFKKIAEDLPSLEKRLGTHPKDFRVIHQLIAYYTKDKITKEKLHYLRQKQQKNLALAPIYNEVYNLYLQRSLKSFIHDPSFGIAFEFPQHWKPRISAQELSVENDGYVFQIKKTQQPLDILTFTTYQNDKTFRKAQIMIMNRYHDKVTCVTSYNRWCGTAINPLTKNGYNYYIVYQFKNEEELIPDLDAQKTQDQLKVMDEIVSSAYFVQ